MFKRLLENYIILVTSRPRWTLAIFGVVCVIATLPAKNIVLDNDFRKMVFQGQEDVAFMDQHTDTFGPDDTSLLIILNRKGVDLSTFAAFTEKLGDQFANHEETLRVASMAHSPIMQSANDELLISPAFGSRSLLPGDDTERLKQLRQSAGARYLVSSDANSFILSVTLRDDFKVAQNVVAPATRARELTEKAIADSGLPITAHYAGVPFTRVASMQGMRRDLGTLLPIVNLLAAFMLYWQFRRKHAVLLPLLSIFAACSITAGIATLLGEAITPLSVAYPILLLVIGIGDGLHFLTRYHEERLAGKTYRSAAIETGKTVGGACFLTSFTSAIGFASLTFTDMPILHGFGLLTAIGIMVAFVVLLTVVPAGLALSDSPPVSMSPRVVRGLAGPINVITTLPRSIALSLLGVALCGICIFFSRDINIDYTFTKFLSATHPVSVGNTLLDHEFSGISNLDVNFQGDPDAFKDPMVLRKMDEALQFFTDELGALRSFGLSSVVKELNLALRGQNTIPDTRAAVAQLLLMTEGNAESILERIVTDDFSEARANFSMTDPGGVVLTQKADLAQTHLDQLFAGTGVQAKVTGIALLSAHGFNSLVGKLIESLLGALLVIILTLGVVFRSVRIAVASALPNVFPLLAAVGFFGATRINLELMPSVMFCIAIGIAVDDTIHLIARFREEFKGDNLQEAIRESVVHSLGAVVNTSLILIMGFCVLGFSSFPGNRVAGWLGAGIVGVAFLADLLFVPAVLTVVYTKKGK